MYGSIFAERNDVYDVLINVWIFLSTLIPWNTHTSNTDEFPVPSELLQKYWNYHLLANGITVF